jgi:hypothetical protein
MQSQSCTSLGYILKNRKKFNFLSSIFTLLGTALLLALSACMPMGKIDVDLVDGGIISPEVEINPGNLSLTSSNNILVFDDSFEETFEGSGEFLNVWLGQRQRHTVTPLPSGKVLIIGGIDDSPSTMDSVELFDPAGNEGAGSITLLNPITNARLGHTATLLPSGNVLIIGGWHIDNGPLSSVELYDPAANDGLGSVTALTPLMTPSFGHKSFLLNSGKVLVLGTGGESVSLYDPAGTGSVTTLAPLNEIRQYYSATMLNSGKILIVGGTLFDTVSSTVELYDPEGAAGAGSTITLAPISTARSGSTSILLSSGKVLILGGVDDFSGAVLSVELYDPTGGGSVSPLASLPAGQYTSSVLLPTGNILTMGQSSGGLYDPSGTGAFTAISSFTSLPRDFETATVLNDGRVWLSGGYDLDYSHVHTWAIFSSFETQKFSATGGTGDIELSLFSGLGFLYPSGLFVPAAPGQAIIRATDSIGKYDDAVITVE